MKSEAKTMHVGPKTASENQRKVFRAVGKGGSRIAGEFF